ncbi:HVA22-like protein k isoform X4 [Glycine max]|uniref:HVA22-like protein n=1 Tax=Glycine max TaxID=3847 RepID=K7LT07_SOYBN|nr:HVA22-like protein k isoform X4 [Glycine max]
MASPELGLRLLLSPVTSDLLLRTACCSIGLALPVYSTFKAIENNDPYEQQRCLLYWAAYGSFSAAEMFAEKLLSWIPLYYHMKFAFLVWLQLPTLDGARQLYSSHLRPFLLKHQARMDLIVEFVYGAMPLRWLGISFIQLGGSQMALNPKRGRFQNQKKINTCFFFSLQQ